MGVTLQTLPGTLTLIFLALNFAIGEEVNLNVTCDFDKDMCNYQNGNGFSAAKWVKNSPGHEAGAAMHLHNSPNKFHGTLQSGIMPQRTGRYCLQFWYDMSGGVLTVRLRVTGGKKRIILLWELADQNGDRQWQLAQAPFELTSTAITKLEFYGDVHGLQSSTIAIDDIDVTNSSGCSSMPDICDFDPIKSSWNNSQWQSKTSNYKDNIIIMKDHTEGVQPGNFMVLNAPRAKGHSAVLTSPEHKFSYDVCIQIFYQLFSNNPDGCDLSINLILRRRDENGRLEKIQRRLWKVTSQLHTDQTTWNAGQAPVPYNADYSTFQVEVVGSAGNSPCDVIAIDDVSLIFRSSSACLFHPPSAEQTTLPTSRPTTTTTSTTTTTPITTTSSTHLPTTITTIGYTAKPTAVPIPSSTIKPTDSIKTLTTTTSTKAQPTVTKIKQHKSNPTTVRAETASSKTRRFAWTTSKTISSTSQSRSKSPQSSSKTSQAKTESSEFVSKTLQLTSTRATTPTTAHLPTAISTTVPTAKSTTVPTPSSTNMPTNSVETLTQRRATKAQTTDTRISKQTSKPTTDRAKTASKNPLRTSRSKSSQTSMQSTFATSENSFTPIARSTEKRTLWTTKSSKEGQTTSTNQATPVTITTSLRANTLTNIATRLSTPVNIISTLHTSVKINKSPLTTVSKTGKHPTSHSAILSKTTQSASPTVKHWSTNHINIIANFSSQLITTTDISAAIPAADTEKVDLKLSVGCAGGAFLIIVLVVVVFCRQRHKKLQREKRAHRCSDEWVEVEFDNVIYQTTPHPACADISPQPTRYDISLQPSSYDNSPQPTRYDISLQPSIYDNSPQLSRPSAKPRLCFIEEREHYYSTPMS